MNHPNRSQKWQMTPDQFTEIIAELTQGNQSELARLIGVDGRTVRRWICGELNIPKPIQVLLRSLQIMTADQREKLIQSALNQETNR